MSGKKKLETLTSSQRKIFKDLITEEQASKYFKSLAHQMLQIHKTWRNNERRIATNNIGYAEIKKYLDTLIEEKLPNIIDTRFEKHIIKLAKDYLNGITLNASTRKKINDKFEDMLLKYLDDLPEKERSKLMMKYLMCRK